MDALTFQDSIAALKHPDHSVRCKSALALGKSEDKRAVEPLIVAMTDANEFVRMDVACALGQIGDTRAVEPLIHALHDPHGYVRREAALALGELGDIRAVDRLIAMLEGDQGAAVAKALFKITGEAYERILMSGRTPEIVYKQAIERKLKDEKSEIIAGNKKETIINKRCGLCGEIVESGLLACPKCASGVFESEKVHREPQSTERAVNPIPESESKKSWLGRLFGGRKQDSMGTHHEPQQSTQSKEASGKRSGMLTVSIGDTNVGYRVVAVKKGAMEHLSVVLAERVSDTTPTKYVVWAFDGTGFKSGIYENDRKKAQRVFDSRTN